MWSREAYLHFCQGASYDDHGDHDHSDDDDSQAYLYLCQGNGDDDMSNSNLYLSTSQRCCLTRTCLMWTPVQSLSQTLSTTTQIGEHLILTLYFTRIPGPNF